MGLKDLTAKAGNKVKVHYTGTLEDGTVFDTSKERDPIEFTIGEGMVILGFEQAVIGMKMGETKTVTLQPEEAYGQPQDDFIQVVPRKQLPQNMPTEPGQLVQIEDENGRIAHVSIVAADNDNITIDGNHQLAGKVLRFEIQLLDIGFIKKSQK